MKRLYPLAGGLLAITLMLSSCGTTTTGNSSGNTGSGGSGTVISQPLAGNLTATVARAITLGTGSQSAEVRIGNTAATSGTAAVVSAPAGLTVTVGEVKALPSGELSVPLTFSGTAANGSTATIKVTVGSNVVTVEVPVFSFSALPITATGISSDYQAASIRFLPDGSALLSSGLGGNSVERQNLLHFTPTTNTFDISAWPITRAGETISSATVAPDGSVWVSVHGMSSQGGYLLSRDTAGNVATHWVSSTRDQFNSLATTTDGRVWFLPYSNPGLEALTPATDKTQTYAVPEQAGSLVRGQDGKLYYASFYANPAVIQFDPATGKTQTFAVGTAGRSLPGQLFAAADGTIWFIEARNGAVWQLDPTTGKQTQFALPTGARPSEVVVTPSGQVWVEDATNAMLYTTFTNSSGTKILVGVSALMRGTTPDGPMALTVAPDGKVWYVAAGQLVRQQ